MKPPIKPLTVFQGPCPIGQLATPQGCARPSPCPQGKVLGPDGNSCIFSPPPEGYLCSNLGVVYHCGGVNQPTDPCAQARSFVPTSICVVTPADVPPAVDGADLCPVATLGMMVAMLFAVACL